MAILTNMKWFLIVVLICISVIIKHFSYAYWPSVYLLWRNVSLGLLSILGLLPIGFFWWWLFRAASVAYGSSQSRGQTRAVALAYTQPQPYQIQATSLTYATFMATLDL